MKHKELEKLSDQELLELAKKEKATNIMDAVLIGFLIGVVFYSIVKKTYGFLTLIPLFFAYKIIKKPKNIELQKILKERNLK